MSQLEKRSLSGIFFRNHVPGPNGGHWENRVFEDLSEEQMYEKMEGKSLEWVKSLAVQLAKTLREVGDLTGVTAEK